MCLSFGRSATLVRAGLALVIAALTSAPAWAQESGSSSVTTDGTNPIVRDVFTADPAPLVVGDTLYLYVGQDNAAEGEMFTMPGWRCYSTKDVKSWTDHGMIMKSDDFQWAEPNSAWASEVIERNGKFWFYTTVRFDKGQPHAGSAIGVAVADHPTGPFKDAKGEALVYDRMTPDGRRPWEDIDPTVFEDDDGTLWMAWGNGDCYLVKLKDNMVELDGEIMNITDQLPHYTEGPWIYKRGDLYYLAYPYINPEESGSEQIGYATADKITGPWTYRGRITGPGENSFTIHPGIVEFKDQWYFFYHDASLEIDGVKGTLGRRNARVEYLTYNDDGTIRPIEQTQAGVSGPAPNDDNAPAATQPATQPAADAPHKQTFVLQHGAWAGGWEWKRVGEALQAKGHTVYRPTLTGQGERVHLAGPEVDLDTHIQDVVNVILFEDLHDVVLMGHSYGGMVVTGVADRVPERIKALIYVDAAVPEDGETAFDAFGRPAPPEGTEMNPPGWPYPQDRAPPYIVPHPMGTMRQPISLKNPERMSIPTYYLLTVDPGREPEEDGFYRHYERAQKYGWATGIMEADHVPNINQPKALAELLDAAPAKARVGDAAE